MKPVQRLRDLPGVLVRDLSRYRDALSRSGHGFSSDPAGWISLCNRIETLRVEDGRRGFACDWRWGSPLHAADVLPRLRGELLRVALEEWPIRFAPQPLSTDVPRVSFVFAHSGRNRLPQLVRTLQSVFAQSVACECIVIDQSETPLISRLPEGIRYRHLGKDAVPTGWYKSWAYNVGARLARAPILVFHDGDICAPAEYAAEVCRVLEAGDCGAASLQRLLFYLSESDTRQLNLAGGFAPGCAPTMAFQNWKGGTIAIRRDAFESIGGFDEGFVDWGGEDDEFYDRCASIGHCRAGFLPFVHLWHPPQPDRKSSTNPNIAQVMPWRMGLSHAARVEELGQRDWGNPLRPDPLLSYKVKATPPA